MNKLDEITEALQQFKPLSIFLYGSRGRGDHTDKSDYEIGVIFADDAYIPRSVIHATVQLDSVRIYPFKLTELRDGTFDTPFQKTIYRRELVEGSRTIYGEKVVEHLDAPKITTIDLIQEIRFDLGRSLSAMLSLRAGDLATAHEAFSKSCLFGLRCLEMLKLGIFVNGYDQAFELRDNVVSDPAHLKVIEAAYALRGDATSVAADLVFDNISFLNFVEREIMGSFAEAGMQELA